MPNTILPPDELIVEIQETLGFAEYHGSRALLEAEGVIPAGTQWPQGYDEVRWRAGPMDYQLYRQRPAGAKGPRTQFANSKTQDRTPGTKAWCKGRAALFAYCSPKGRAAPPGGWKYSVAETGQVVEGGRVKRFPMSAHCGAACGHRKPSQSVAIKAGYCCISALRTAITPSLPALTTMTPVR